MEKVVKSKIELNLHFMFPDILYKFQMICFKGTEIIFAYE